MKYFVFCFLVMFFSLNCQQSHSNKGDIKVTLGIEEFIANNLDLIKGKNIGIITNHTGILPDSTHLVDVLYATEGVTIKAIFGPEHGIRGNAPDGKAIEDSVDTKTNIPVYSLYGEIKKPTKEMLKDIDVLIFDIQDIGARFYTFTSTMFLTMEAAAEHHIQYIVLDRPNPITGIRIGGAVLNDSISSFVGMHKISIMHGLTVGELAKLVNGEGWMKNGVKAELTVIRMKNWARNMWYDNTGLPWVKPSPNMATLATATVYPGLCFIEGTNVSEGRGTEKPFEIIGAPFIDMKFFSNTLNSYGLKGVEFEPIEFTPVNIELVTVDPKYEGITCGGVFIKVTDRNSFNPIETGLYILYTLKQLYPDDFQWRSPSRSTSRYFVDLLAGTADLRVMLDEGYKPIDILNKWNPELQQYIKITNKYLLY